MLFTFVRTDKLTSFKSFKELAMKYNTFGIELHSEKKTNSSLHFFFLKVLEMLFLVPSNLSICFPEVNINKMCLMKKKIILCILSLS